MLPETHAATRIRETRSKPLELQRRVSLSRAPICFEFAFELIVNC
jgi:hypothetical protein